MKKITLGSLFAALALGLPAQDAVSARAAYQDRQALAEVPRLVQQFDQLAVNQDAPKPRYAPRSRRYVPRSRS